MRWALAFISFICLTAAAAEQRAPEPGFATRRVQRACVELAGRKFGHLRVFAADSVNSGSFQSPDGARHEVPPFCRIQGDATPTRHSQIRVELWMPTRGWNGRYYQLGNGGFAGNIAYALMAAELRRGNAVAATDTGHRGTGFDATWARNQPDRIIDYAYRSLKETSDAAGALIEYHYGDAARFRYFVGCSNGGRQALMLAQRFPGDWDGILAGAPALDWTRQLASFAWIQHVLRSDSKSWIPAAKLPAIQRAALASCTPAARVIDGIAADPRECSFESARLVCAGDETDECLTREQLAALSLIQRGPRDQTSGQQLYFGFEPTSAAVKANWEQWIVNADRSAPSQLTFAEQFFANMIFAAADWQVTDFQPARDFALAQSTRVAGRPLADVLNATSDDLSQFHRSGAKLIMYFGWADALISPRAGAAYYERVAARMGGMDRAQAFFRLFMVPGMTHCQGGPGADAFGQSAFTPGLRDDAAHDVRRALEEWVERGEPPAKLIAAKYAADDPTYGVTATRVLCPYPQVEGC